MAKKRIDFRSTLYKRYVKELAEDGMRAIEEAIRTNTFINQSGNLQDSYASAVYYDGYMIEGTMNYYEPQTATEGKKYGNKILHGREEARRYLLNYRPRTKGLSLILIAAMPYEKVLEQGYFEVKGKRINLTKKYKVITGANAFMRQLAQKWAGKFGRKAKGIRVNVNPITQ